jgi:hypothetical protein
VLEERSVIEIADEVYSMNGRYTSNETVFMTGAFQSEVRIQALERADDRFMGTGHDGVEYADIEIAYERRVYTPNYTSEPEMTEFGITLYVDCKAFITDPMRTTFRRILEEEVRAAGIDEARIVAAKLSSDESRMVPVDRDESIEAAALAAWKAAAFAKSIELCPDGTTVDFRVVQHADWDGSTRLERLLFDVVRRHTWLSEDPRRWPSRLQHATDLPSRVVLEYHGIPDATIEKLIQYNAPSTSNGWASTDRRTSTLLVIRSEGP